MTSTYREFRPRGELSGFVACTWERSVGHHEPRPAARILPDGCVDLIWRDGRVLVAGPDREPFTSELTQVTEVVGLRLRPGAAGAALGLPARDLLGLRVGLDDVWGRPGAELGERVGEAGEGAGRRAALEQALFDRRRSTASPDPIIFAAIRALGRPGTRIDSLARAVNLSDRQLRRRFDDAVGYGPKLLDRILRFQRFVARVSAPLGSEEPLALIAAGLGYSDQAHLGRDCVEFSGLTPARLAATR